MDNGKIMFFTVKVYTMKQEIVSIKVRSKMESTMGKVKSNIKTEIHIKDSINKGKNKEMEYILGLTETIMTESGKMI